MALRKSLDAYAPQPASLGQDKAGEKRAVALGIAQRPGSGPLRVRATAINATESKRAPPAANYLGADALWRLLLRLTFQKHLQLTGRLR